jgi:tryptophan-rich sensory protein
MEKDASMAVRGARWVVLAAFLVVVLGVGFTIGMTVRPGAWYEALYKPFFTPPNWLFGPAWTIVYTLIAIAGWRVWLTAGIGSVPAGLWIAQMVLNWAWSPVFFGAHLPGAGLAVILALLAVSLMFIARVRDRVARWCFVPYVAWLTYATALNLAIVVLN